MSMEDLVLRTIREIESSGRYDASNKESGAYGGYQFMPGTWKNASINYAMDYGMKPDQIDIKDSKWQDKVARNEVGKMLRDGLSIEQIASKWNSGRADGVTSEPGYIPKFKSIFNRLSKVPEGFWSKTGDVIASPASAAEIKWTEDDEPMQAQASQPSNPQTKKTKTEINWDMPPPSAKTPIPQQAKDPMTAKSFGRAAYELLEPTIDAGALTAGGMVGAASPIPGGAFLGAGMAYSAAQQGKRLAREALDMEQPIPLAERSIEAGKDVGKGAALEAGGQVVGKALELGKQGYQAGKRAVGDFARKTFGAVDNPMVGVPAKQVYEDFVNEGVTPLAGAVSGNKAIQGLENAMMKMPGGSKTIQESTNKALNELRQASRSKALEFSPDIRETRAGLGEFVLGKAEKAGERFSKVSERVYNAVESRIGNVKAGASNTAEWVKQQASSFGTTTKTLKDGSTVEELSDVGKEFMKSKEPYVGSLYSDASSGALNFASLRYLRGKVGQKLNNPLLVDTESAQTGVLKKLYETMTKDMEAAAANAGPKALRDFKAADTWYHTQNKEYFVSN